MWVANQNSGTIGVSPLDGQTSGFFSGEINEPTAITAGPDGNLWFTNGSPFSSHRRPSGASALAAWSPSSPATA